VSTVGRRYVRLIWPRDTEKMAQLQLEVIVAVLGGFRR
jgi:hypothetical protein